MNWKSADIKRFADKGMVDKKFIQDKPSPAGLSEIISTLIRMKIPYVQEYKFDSKRKFRFDIYIPSLNCAIEYEGIVSENSRHTNLLGYSKDCEKYNLAAINGIKVLRYTAFNFNKFSEDIIKLHE